MHNPYLLVENNVVELLYHLTGTELAERTALRAGGTGGVLTSRVGEGCCIVTDCTLYLLQFNTGLVSALR